MRVGLSYDLLRFSLCSGICPKQLSSNNRFTNTHIRCVLCVSTSLTTNDSTTAYQNKPNQNQKNHDANYPLTHTTNTTSNHNYTIQPLPHHPSLNTYLTSHSSSVPHNTHTSFPH